MKNFKQWILNENFNLFPHKKKEEEKLLEKPKEGTYITKSTVDLKKYFDLICSNDDCLIEFCEMVSGHICEFLCTDAEYVEPEFRGKKVKILVKTAITEREFNRLSGKVFYGIYLIGDNNKKYLPSLKEKLVVYHERVYSEEDLFAEEDWGEFKIEDNLTTNNGK